jgi:uncharacterized protein (DUF952 family)
MYIYHIVTPAWWDQFKEKSHYESETLSVENFIHCSTLEQIQPTLNRHFKHISVVYILKLEVTKLEYQPIYELAPAVGQSFPHIYGPINLDAVVAITEIKSTKEGWPSIS